MSRKIIQYQHYIASWLNSSIHEFLETWESQGEKTRYALITCLDSDLEPASLASKSPAFQQLRDREPIGKGLLVPTAKLIDAHRQKHIFFGFDEVWFFPKKPVEPKPTTAWLVGPAKLNQHTLNKLGKWMAAQNCSLALGDGNGLNIIVKARGLVRVVLSHSLDQPDEEVREISKSA